VSDHGRELSPAELERQGRAALGRPVTAHAERSRVESVNGAHRADVANVGHKDGKAVDKHTNGDQPDRRSPQQIERDIEAARANLAVTLDEIVDRVKPANVAARAKDKVRAQFIDSDTGAPRKERIVPLAGGVAGLILLVVLVKSRGKSDKNVKTGRTGKAGKKR
jgi:hypothetical protein